MIGISCTIFTYKIDDNKSSAKYPTNGRNELVKSQGTYRWHEDMKCLAVYLALSTWRHILVIRLSQVSKVCCCKK